MALLQNGCYQGYKPADELEDDERGPRACYQSCLDLGMHMSAFVLVDHDTSGCVCSPNPGQSPQQAELEGGAAAGAAYAMIQAERAAQQQAQAQASPPK